MYCPAMTRAKAVLPCRYAAETVTNQTCMPLAEVEAQKAAKKRHAHCANGSGSSYLEREQVWCK